MPSFAAASSAALRAIFAAASEISFARAARLYSPSVIGDDPKLFVSTASLPAAKYAAWMSRMISGAVRFSHSLHPSYSPHAAAPGFHP